jgi:hypothetical protein
MVLLLVHGPSLLLSQFFKLDYQTYENNGMVNLSNAIDISFNTGPRGF